VADAAPHLKAPLHRLARAVSQDEILAILKFGVVALIALPLLPNRGLGPYQAVNPRDVGFMVVLLTAISLIGISSSASSARGKASRWPGSWAASRAPPPSRSPSRGRRGRPRTWRGRWPRASWSPRRCSTLAARSCSWCSTLPSAVHLLPRLGALLAVGLVLSLLLLRRAAAPREQGPALSLGNPGGAGHAVVLAALFGVVLLIARVAQAELGTMGLWAVGAVGGLVDVDSVSVAAARLRQQDVVGIPVAAGAYLLATLSNLLFKGGVTFIVGGRPLARQVWPAFAVLAVLTIAALFV
jgi:uncharacterized membrane protein (DUF4010 family)